MFSLIRALFLISFLSLPQIGFSQFAKNNQIFFNPHISFGTHGGGGWKLNYIYKQKLAFQIGFSSFSGEPAEQPRDASTSTVLFWRSVSEQIISSSIMGGRSFYFSGKGYNRFRVLGGLAWSQMNLVTNYQAVGTTSGGSTFLGYTTPGTVYTYDEIYREALSLVISGQVDLRLIDWLGFTTGTSFYINEHRWALMLDLGLSFGFVFPPRVKSRNRYNLEH